MEQKKIMIMGVGNILLTDEGFGVRAVEYLQAKYTWPENVRLEDGGTQGLLLMSTLMDCDTLVVLDVVLGPEKPGTIYMLEGEDLRKSLSFRDSMHQTDLLDTLITCSMAGHDVQAVVFGLQPFDYHTMQVGLTPEAEKLLPEFCTKVVAALAERGIATAQPVA
nr:HyaD/HybD family hydrogenase maturation endopeptidase [Desulfovibrio desulfuricans]